MTFAGVDSVRPPLEIDAAEFVAVKSFRAKGKRLTTYNIGEITEIELAVTETPAEDDSEPAEQEPDDNQIIEPEISDDELRDELTGQKRIF